MVGPPPPRGSDGTQRRLIGALAVAAALTAAPGAARANGTFPSASQLVAEPGTPSHLALRTTFGLIVSPDAGQSWTWTCEDALGYTNNLPAIAVLAGGTLVLGIPEGITAGMLTGCDYPAASGINANVVDLTRIPGNATGVLATSFDYGTYGSQVFESDDAGASFAALSEPFPDFVATTIDVAPTDPNVIYVSGMPLTTGKVGLLLRSADHGKTFTAHEIPDAVGASWPYIGAVDPADPDKLYVRLASFPGRLKVTDDGGKTFGEPLTTDDEMLGFALSPDGKTVVVSSPTSGTFRADTDTLDFEQVACHGVSCLMWNSEGLYACGNQSVNGFALGRSLDEGRSYERVLDFSCITPREDCDGATPVGAMCPSLWPMVQMQLEGFGTCDPNAPPPEWSGSCPGEAGGPSGSGGAAGGGAAEGGSTAAGGGAPGTGGGPAPGTPGKSGCGCRWTRGDPHAAWLTLISLAGFWVQRRNKRRRRHVRTR